MILKLVSDRKKYPGKLSNSFSNGFTLSKLPAAEEKKAPESAGAFFLFYSSKVS